MVCDGLSALVLGGRMDLLDGLTTEERRRVLAVCQRRRFARREVLFHEGDPADCLHLIAKGRVAVRCTTLSGATATMDVRGTGEVVGELALLPPSAPRSATVVALEPVETWSMSVATFTALRRQQPEVQDALLGMLARRSRRQAEQLMEALYLPVELRVLRRLDELTRLYGTADATVTIPLTQDDLAGLAGTTRETVNRVLNEQSDRGVVALARGRIMVLQPEGLRSRVG
jgi:CRP-like cAMP-binding protein